MKHTLALTLIDGIGPAKIKSLIDHYETSEEVFKISAIELEKKAGLSTKIVNSIINCNFSEAEEVLEWCDDYDISIVTPKNHSFPQLLREIYDTPQLLYVMGDVKALHLPSVGVVGMRKPDNYGREVCKKIATDIARAGGSVVSGLAYGIDKIAHQSALEAGGRTVAVLGTGLDMIYPTAHRDLAVDISKNGALISEYAPRHGAMPYRFIQRNRLISGLSGATVVVEAAKKSGSLATADFAINQGRELFAVPGSILSNCCEGTNHLIAEGAEPLLETSSLLKAAGIRRKTEETKIEQGNFLEDRAVATANLSKDEETIAYALSGGVLKRIDQLMEITNFNQNQLFELLLNMELSGVITQEAGQLYRMD
jgi:DNA processing protein